MENVKNQLYMAPLEGITGYIFRNALAAHFGEGIDKYFTPFFMPHEKRAFSDKELREILPGNNTGISLVPQIMTNDADDFTRLKNEFRALGYTEVNINFGCPSRTVASKKRGAGALEDVDRLDRFFDAVYAKPDGEISVKTRLGVSNPEEFTQILKVYSKYPIKELIIHPRVLKEQYGGTVHRDIFMSTYESYSGTLCYNGDIVSTQDYEGLLEDLTGVFENAQKATKSIGSNMRPVNVMIGRGILRNPGLIREIATGRAACNYEIEAFMSQLADDYSRVFSGQTPVLFKLKEIWNFLRDRYPEEEKTIKKLLKSRTMSEYKMYEKAILGR